MSRTNKKKNKDTRNSKGDVFLKIKKFAVLEFIKTIRRNVFALKHGPLKSKLESEYRVSKIRNLT